MSMAEAIPLHNKTALSHDIYNGWMPPPTVRGTSDILYTCLITISLCVYTAIHPNIPHPDNRYPWVNRTAWVFTGILAPEYVLWTAFVQYREARQLVSFLNSTHREMRDDSNRGKNPPFNLTYGFFVAMGGFRVDFDGTLQQGEASHCLTAKGCMRLAELGTFIEVDDRAIEGRQKANAVAKLFVCIEVLWMSVQCIARASSGLPLTLLEIHTFVHVVCAVLIYTLWFQKPFEVSIAIAPPLEGLDRDLASLVHFESNNDDTILVTLNYAPQLAARPSSCLCVTRDVKILQPVMIAEFTKAHEEVSESTTRENGVLNEYADPLNRYSTDFDRYHHRYCQTWTVDRAYLDESSAVFSIRPETREDAVGSKCPKCHLDLSDSLQATTFKIPHSSRLGRMLLIAKAVPGGYPPRK